MADLSDSTLGFQVQEENPFFFFFSSVKPQASEQRTTTRIYGYSSENTSASKVFLKKALTLRAVTVVETKVAKASEHGSFAASFIYICVVLLCVVILSFNNLRFVISLCPDSTF